MVDSKIVILDGTHLPRFSRDRLGKCFFMFLGFFQNQKCWILSFNEAVGSLYFLWPAWHFSCVHESMYTSMSTINVAKIHQC